MPRTALVLGLVGCVHVLPYEDSAVDAETVDRIDHDNVTCTRWEEQDVCRIRGVITSDLTLEAHADLAWVLEGQVFVGDGGEQVADLTIEPGVTVFGSSRSQDSMLVVSRGSHIYAEGTAQEPIVFTTSLEPELAARGSWGGLVINGAAPINQPGGEAQAEGGSGPYGGDDPDDDSGVLRYVRVEYAGRKLSTQDELNGISFGGVGRGTVVEYVQVHGNADDGVEFYGGTVDVRHLVITGVGDDAIDWTEGWQGTVQHALLVQADDAGERAIEGDNLSADPDASPRSHPLLANITSIGCGERCISGAGGEGMVLRRGTAAEILNSVFVDAQSACVDIDGGATYAQAGTPGAWMDDLRIVGTALHDCLEGPAKDGDDEDAPFLVADWLARPAAMNRFEDPGLDGWMPAEGSPSVSGAFDLEDPRLDQTEHIGAFLTKDWTEGWTVGLHPATPEGN